MCVCVCVYPFTHSGGHTSYGGSWDPNSFFFKFELKPTGKDSADPTPHEFMHHGGERKLDLKSFKH